MEVGLGEHVHRPPIATLMGVAVGRAVIHQVLHPRGTDSASTPCASPKGGHEVGPWHGAGLGHGAGHHRRYRLRAVKLSCS